MESREGRLIDIPYRTSPPLLFVYQQTAQLQAGAYTFPAGGKSPFTPERPIRPNSLYLFQTMDFAMDVEQNDFVAAPGSSAFRFSMYIQSDAGGPALREPVPLVKYLDKTPYILSILGSEMLGSAYPGMTTGSAAPTVNYNRLQGNVVGTLTQTAALIGKTSLTATMLFSVQEVTDDTFIAEFNARASRVRARPQRHGSNYQ